VRARGAGPKRLKIAPTLARAPDVLVRSPALRLDRCFGIGLAKPTHIRARDDAPQSAWRPPAIRERYRNANHAHPRAETLGRFAIVLRRRDRRRQVPAMNRSRLEMKKGRLS
jgi:hypothetical protein